MKIAISGASGFIGSNLSKYFKEKGHEIIPLNRTIFQDDYLSELKKTLSRADVVINLAGAPINHRWTEPYQKNLYDSRILTTRKIVSAINSLDHKPQLFLSASAVGYYPSTGCYDEYSSICGNGFLSELCEQWEHEANKVSSDVRLAITRFGVVLSKKGGAFEKMTFPMKFKVATIIGPGTQLFSWIYLYDLMKAIEHIITQPSINGIINFVSPALTTNKELIKATGKRKKCFLTITIYKFIFDVLMGKSSSFITEGQCVMPKKLLDSGFDFDVPTVDKLLDALYN